MDPPSSSSHSTGPSASSKVFAISELMDIIGRFLTTNDQLHLSMTCRLCHQTVAPLFWTDLNLLDKTRAERLLQSPDAQRALSRNTVHIRRLKILTSALLHFVDNMTREQHQPPLSVTADATASGDAPSAAATVSGEGTSSPAPLVRSTPRWLPESPLPNPLTVALPRMTQLGTLEYQLEQVPYIYGHSKDRFPRISGLPQLMWLFNSNAALTHIRVKECDIQSPLEALTLIQAITNLHSLKELDLTFRNCAVLWKDVACALFYCLSPTIETLKLVVYSALKNVAPLVRRSSDQDMDSSGHTTALPHLYKRDIPLGRLKKLYFRGDRYQDARLIGLFLQHCPALEIFRPPQWKYDAFIPLSKALAQAVVTHCPRLRGLETCDQVSLDVVKVLPDHSLESIVDGELDSKTHPILLMASKKQFNSLLEIRLEHRSHVKSVVLQEILRACSSLEHLIVKGFGCPAIRLKHLVEQPWVCMRLKTLEIRVDMRQVSVPAYVLGRMPIIHEETWTMLKKFYRQLGALADLEVLCLTTKSKEMQWLDENGQVRDTLADRARPSARRSWHSGQHSDEDDEEDEEDSWSSGDGYEQKYACSDRISLFKENSDATFPGLLSLGNEATGRPGYLSWLSGLTKLRELRGHVQVTTTETSKTVGQKELQWMLDYWPRLEVIELLPALVRPHGQPRDIFPVDMSPPHIVWFKQHRPDICIQQESW
ncbi:hypothetical protein BGW39_010320 [Mortierella sp. 14UC]|nr:hypothetical protein BGW39_010320 [Mortierella sp. 14UC]